MRKPVRFQVLLSLLVSTALISCDKFDPIEDAPSFIEINDYDLITTSTQGGAADRIEDIWVTVDSEFIGVFPIPAKVPINAEDVSEISIAPGIRMNGISSARVRHPYMANHEVSLELFRDSVVEVRPQFSYTSGADFAWVEDFEEAGITLLATGNSFAEVARTDDPNIVFSGKSAHLQLQPSQDKFECVSDAEYDLPGGGNPVILEFSYRSNNTVTIGTFIRNPGAIIQSPVLTLNPSDDWKRIYINLTQEVSGNPSNIGVAPFFGFLRDPDLEGDANVYLDNIKLIY